MTQLTYIDAYADAVSSAVLFHGCSDRAYEWIALHCDVEDWQWIAGQLAVDHRFAQDIVRGMREDGLRVSTAFFYVEEEDSHV